MKKLILKKEYKIIKYVISEEDEPFACGEFDPDKAVAGDIYAAAVRERISSSDTYFCDIGDTRTAYLPCNSYKTGEMSLLQVKTAPHDGKGACMTDVITFSGRYAVVEFLPSPHVYDTYTCRGDKNGFSAQIKFSKKIKKSGLTKLLGSIAESCLYSFAADLRSLGYLMEIIVRTEAETLCKDGFITDDDQFKNEIEKFFELFKTIQSRFEERRTDRGISRLYSVGFFEYINRVYRISSFDSVITSEPCFVGMVKSDAPWLNEKINLLRESSSGYDIFTLINASRKLPSLLGKRIYLKCGGEIIIERTEAMTVIDINSSSASLSYYDVNAEAAVEIMRQLQLRNIGGIIMCDFINMDKNENEKLENMLRELACKDYAKCTVYGFTRLGVMEIARKRSC